MSIPLSLQLCLVTPCIWLETTHTCNPPHYGLWVILYFFTICICGLCFLPLLLVFVMKCVKMHCCLPHNPYCWLLSSPAHLYIINSLPIHHCLPTIICVMLISIVFCFLLFFFAVFFVVFVFLCACASFLLLLPLVSNLMCSLVILYVAFLLLLLSFTFLNEFDVWCYCVINILCLQWETDTC